MFEIWKNWKNDIWISWNIIDAINYSIGFREAGENGIWGPGWGLIIRYFQKVGNFLVLIDFDSILISPIVIDNLRTLFMDKMLIIYNFLITNG
jgi:hypothetical protein